MSERRLFGTDGIRGRANVEPMTPELALKLGRAITFVARRGKARPPRSCWLAIWMGVCKTVPETPST